MRYFLVIIIYYTLIVFGLQERVFAHLIMTRLNLIIFT